MAYPDWHRRSGDKYSRPDCDVHRPITLDQQHGQSEHHTGSHARPDKNEGRRDQKPQPIANI
ncbi:hypothetical protein [Mycobacteroides abscessus]|uniref:hypothetical protein n=1 Tax=Mycobacteroides abscessus TaxID=36809 RepID=UPI001041BE41|nr:hypothetical protein [Mycobacteroides abscessus]